MRCFCCDRDVVIARMVKVRRLRKLEESELDQLVDIREQIAGELSFV